MDKAHLKHPTEVQLVGKTLGMDWAWTCYDYDNSQRKSHI